MFGNGAAIGSAVIITKTVRKIIRKDRHPVRAVCCAAGAGATWRGIAGRLIATTVGPMPATTTMASALFSSPSSSCKILSLFLFSFWVGNTPVPWNYMS